MLKPNSENYIKIRWFWRSYRQK